MFVHTEMSIRVSQERGIARHVEELSTAEEVQQTRPRNGLKRQEGKEDEKDMKHCFIPNC
jgi:hypothetical protein